MFGSTDKINREKDRKNALNIIEYIGTCKRNRTGQST